MGDVYLALENGAVFKGKSFGYDGEAVGELVFTTGMTGYLETLSDPSYYGQIVIQTFPLIGNYGVIPQDFGPGPIYLRAYIVRDWCQEPSNFRSEGNLDSFLREMKIPGLYGVDTRELVRLIRKYGTMNAMLVKSPDISDVSLAELRKYRVPGVGFINSECRMQNAELGTGDGNNNSEFRVQNAELVAGDVSAGADPFLCRDDELWSRFSVAVWDFGCGSRVIDRLTTLGFTPALYRYDSTVEVLLEQKPDGVLLSDGPGDPAENVAIIEEIKKLCGLGVPILGVGLGHQMLALARGARSERLLFGHRGANQPVRECGTSHVFVTTQNHGYAVSVDSLPSFAKVSYENLSDGTCEGIVYNDIPALSVQFELTDDILKAFLKYKAGSAEISAGSVETSAGSVEIDAGSAETSAGAKGEDA